MGGRQPGSPVVIYVGDASYSQSRPATPGHSFGKMSAGSAPRAGLDPHRIHRQFPERWSAYIKAHYRTLSEISDAFDVSEKTARNWWTGRTGANGGHVAIAVDRHPVEAPQMLFAAE